MADQNNDLPEGTDKVIAGASGSSGGAGSGGTGGTSAGTRGFVAETGTTGGTGTAGGSGSSAGSGGTSGGSAGGSGEGGGVMNKLRSSTDKLSGQAGEKARGLVHQGLERGAEALSNVSRMIGDTAEGIDERLGKEYGDYARRAAEAIDSTADSLASKDPEELIEDTRNFVRKSPGVALAGAAVVGFAVARLIKSGLSGLGGDDRDFDERPQSRNSGTTGGSGAAAETTGATGTGGTTGATGTGGTTGATATGGTSGATGGTTGF
jgi:ElaB/YqjD/DUF883 family membrane-anchored ribosome-binding protein